MADRYWVGGSGNWADPANWSATSGGAGGASVPTASDNVFFYQSATYTVTITSATTANCLDFTASAGSPTFSMGGATINLNGNLDVSGTTGGNFFGAGPTVNFGPTSGGTSPLTINFGARGLAQSGTVTFRYNSSVAFKYQLLSDFSISNTANTVTLVRGELDLNGYTLNCGNFTAANANSKSITSGTGGKIVCNALSGTPFTITGGATTITGDLLVQTTNSTSSSLTIVLDIVTNPISFLFTGSNYGLVFLNSANARVKDITFSGGYSGTWVGRTNAHNVSGNITLSPGMTYGASTGTLSLTGTSGTQTITTNGRTWDGPLNVNGIGGTVQLADALAMGTRILTLTNGTFDGGGYSITGSANISTVGGTTTIKNINTSRGVAQSSGTLVFGTNNTTGAYTHTTGTLNLSGYQLNCTTFASNNANVRTLAFGSGNITCTGTGTVWTTATITNLTITGTPVVNITNSTATATTVNSGTLSEANSISFNFTGGSYSLTFLGTNSYTARDVNFTGFSGTWLAYLDFVAIYGSLTLSSTMTLTSTTTVLSLRSTTAGRTFTSNGKTIPFPVSFNGVGGSWILQDAVTFTGANGRVAQSNGTLDLNGKTLTLGTSSASYATGAGTKNLTFNGGTIVVTSVAALAFNNAAPTGYTTTAGTGTGKISMTGATAKTFEGGGSTYNCTLSNDGAGLLTINGNNAIETVTTTSGNIAITGNNTIATITNTVRPVTYTFTSGTTQTITTSFGLSGLSGSLVTLNASVAGTRATIARSFSTTTPLSFNNYLSIRDMAFSPLPAADGSTPYVWYFGNTNTNVGNNDAAFTDTTNIIYRITTTGAGAWTVPSNWNSATNNVYLIGGGGGGAGGDSPTTNRRGGGGGGGGGFTLVSNFSASPGSSISLVVGAAGTGGAGGGSAGATGGNTTWNGGAYTAGGGVNGITPGVGTGGGGAGGTGSTFNGGAGGNATNISTGGSGGSSGGGGGGAGGPLGAGGNGFAGGTNASANASSGGGGGGNGGGSSATNPNGGNNASGTGGGIAPSGIGLLGGGGGGGTVASTSAGSGGTGVEILNSLGSGGGGGGAGTGATVGPAGVGGGYGGGGGGGAAVTTAGTSAGAAGGQGVIIIVYSASSVSAGSFFFMF